MALQKKFMKYLRKLIHAMKEVFKDNGILMSLSVITGTDDDGIRCQDC